MNAAELTVWGMGTSRCLRVHWMLAEMGLEYAFHPVHPRSGQTMSPEFLKINPRHKVPVLRHGDFVITQSAAILEYITGAFDAPSHVFVPRNAAERGALCEWSYFFMTEFDAHSLYVIRRHQGLAHVYGDAPEACKAAREYFFDQLEAIRPSIASRAPYLFGERISSADILLGTCLDWARSFDFVLPDDITAYHARVKDRPAYKLAFRKTYDEASKTPPTASS